MKLFKNNEVKATNDELLEEVIKLRTELNSLKTATTQKNDDYNKEYTEVTLDEICEKIERGEI